MNMSQVNMLIEKAKIGLRLASSQSPTPAISPSIDANRRTSS
jgi:hypothetical protein